MGLNCEGYSLGKFTQFVREMVFEWAVIIETVLLSKWIRRKDYGRDDLKNNSKV